MQIAVGTVLEGTITKIMPFGAFVKLPDGKSGMIHISEVAATYIEDIRTHLTEGETVSVKVIEIKQQADGKTQIALSCKALLPKAKPMGQKDRTSPQGNVGDAPMEFVPTRPKVTGKTPTDPFEAMMHRFKTVSEERISDLKKQTDGKRGTSRRRNAKG